ncbi:hypothetical protein PIB30_025275 [Stylosanthes scabra]|uniref:Uncharacterized protein n=1 Tax=Stylosanthes scabra TaxID=79078 RepID=A0ABU6UB30_9FABA|nr:hypothetical protein [Stylosanthes scabra]
MSSHCCLQSSPAKSSPVLGSRRRRVVIQPQQPTPSVAIFRLHRRSLASPSCPWQQFCFTFLILYIQSFRFVDVGEKDCVRVCVVFNLFKG